MNLESDVYRIDDFIWACENRYAYECHGRLSLRSGSFFEHSHLSVEKLVLLTMHYYLQNISPKRAASSLEIAVSTVRNYYQSWMNLYLSIASIKMKKQKLVWLQLMEVYTILYCFWKMYQWWKWLFIRINIFVYNFSKILC